MKKKFGKKRKIAPGKTAKLLQVKRLLNRADQFLKTNQADQAATVYASILDIDPDNTQVILQLAQLYVGMREFHKAAVLLEKLRDKGKMSPGNYSNLAMVYCYLQEWDKALEIFTSILHGDSYDAHAYYYWGYAHRGKGEIEASIPLFKKAIDLQPAMVEPYSELCAALEQLGSNDELLELLKQMEEIQTQLQGNSKAGVLFTLARYYDKLQEYSRAFTFLAEANALKMQGKKYDFESDKRFILKLIEQIDQDFISQNEGCGSEDKSPIFIIGMPRSGTSLVEQIIASHPDVDAGGELAYFYNLALSFDYSSPCESTSRLAEQYLQASKRYSHKGRHLTDKLPWNYLFTGLIHVAFPKASIIHCKRDPMDTCFSCYQQNFELGHTYSFDFRTLGKYYRLYEHLMKHWHAILPGRILQVEYEMLVNNLESEVRRIINHCCLPWNDDCLKYYKSERIVDTASRDQVNKPVYNSSINRWKNYEKYMSPLIDALDKSQQ